jgi:hypothetical protein
VAEVGAYGVKIQFSSHQLNNPAFRASMPMVGLFSGERDPARLIARPLAWVDKATGHIANTGELEARYEHPVRAHQTPREVVAAMTSMEELPPPFNQPMPYYVSKAHHGAATLHCQTLATPRGIHCEVTIPSTVYALEWVGRVNGVCGDDYAALEAEARRYEAGAWQAIPVSVRHRLAVWFDFEGDERFLGYINEGEFSKADAGLAGLVVTTHRLVWCKYHHRGSLKLAEDLSLVAEEQGRFATLFSQQGKARRKLIKLRLSDLEELAELLDEAAVSVEVVVEADAPQPGDAADVHVDES